MHLSEKQRRKNVLRRQHGFCGHEVSKTEPECEGGCADQGAGADTALMEVPQHPGPEPRPRSQPAALPGAAAGPTGDGAEKLQEGVRRTWPGRKAQAETVGAPRVLAGSVPAALLGHSPPSRPPPRLSRRGERQGSNAGPGEQGLGPMRPPPDVSHLRAVLQRLLDGQFVDARHGGGRAEPPRLRSPHASPAWPDPPRPPPAGRPAPCAPGLPIGPPAPCPSVHWSSRSLPGCPLAGGSARWGTGAGTEGGVARARPGRAGFRRLPGSASLRGRLSAGTGGEAAEAVSPLRWLPGSVDYGCQAEYPSLCAPWVAVVSSQTITLGAPP